jgi:hypothetical protein
MQTISLVTRTLLLSELGCGNDVRMTVTCGIPLVGKTLAEFVAGDCERIIAEEYEYIRARLEQT